MNKLSACLTPEELTFVNQRSRLVKTWTYAGLGLMAVILGFAIWLNISTPYMINPWVVSSAVNAGIINQSTLNLMAVLLPYSMLATLMVLIICLLFFFIAFANERKHIAIIRKLTASNNA
jgi:hypothetical protein